MSTKAALILGGSLVVASLILVIGLRTFWTPSKPSLVDGQSRADDDDAKKLEGTWEVLSFEARGEKKQPDAIQAMTVTFRGDEFVFSDGEKISSSGHFKLDPSQKPKSLDCTSLVVRMGKTTNETLQCIYDSDGDTLKLCWRKPGGNRPTEFTGKDTDGLMTLKKQ